MSTDQTAIVVEKSARPIKGIRLATACAGIKQAERDDVTLIELTEGSQCAAVFTQNRFCAAPVVLAKQHLAQATPRYLLINSGNANAGMGAIGLADATASCLELSKRAGVDQTAVLPFSTGVIGEPLAVDKITAVMDELITALEEDGWSAAATAIMTTDTVEKMASVQCQYGDDGFTVTGIAKGSGMIHPNMATMLAYIATDVGVSKEVLSECLNMAVSQSFNSITVDGDTSTNDACVLMATGKSALYIDSVNGSSYGALSTAVNLVCKTLAMAIVADGEGATCVVHIEVSGGQSVAECRQVADTVALSPLVKTALFAQDPNWGRVLAAVGRAGIADLDADKVTLYLDEVLIAESGSRAANYDEQAAKRVMERQEYRLCIGLGRGAETAQVTTCDLSYDYVRINAEYRS